MTLSVGLVALEAGMTTLRALVLEVAGMLPFGPVGLLAWKVDMKMLPGAVALGFGMALLIGLRGVSA